MEDAGEKTEQATPEKLRDAQRKGMGLRSPELATLTALVLAALVLLALAPHAARQTAAAARRWIAGAARDSATPLPDGTWITLAEPGLTVVVVTSVAAVALAFMAAAAYGGVRFSGFPLKPDFSRLNPAKGLKRVFSKHTLAETAKTTLKIALLALLAWTLAQQALTATSTATASALAPAGARLQALALQALGWLIALQAVFTAWDLWYARRRYLQQLRMSRHEVKDEHRRQEGDPETRRQRKRLYSSLMAQLRALGNVKDADVVVTNPTHVAVALRYLPDRMNAPAVTCAGRGAIAAMMRTLARRHGVPLVRSPALARALLRDHDIGETVERRHQAGVVHLYRWLLAQPGRRPGFAR